MPGYRSRREVKLFNTYAETVRSMGVPTPHIDAAVRNRKDITRDVANLRGAIGAETSRALSTVVLPPGKTFRDRRVAFFKARDRERMDRVEKYLYRKGCRVLERKDPEPGPETTGTPVLVFESALTFFIFEPRIEGAVLV